MDTVSYTGSGAGCAYYRTDEMIVDNRKRRTEHSPILIDRGGCGAGGELSVYGPGHHWGQASCHPGLLYQVVSEEGPKNSQRLQPQQS